MALARRRGRCTAQRFLLDGPNAVEGALHQDVLVEVFATEDLGPSWAGRLPDGVALHLVADHVMERLSDSRTPQGVVGVGVMAPATLDDVVGPGLLLVCHEVADPGNAGTIVRLADALAARGVVLGAGSVDPYNPKVGRAAAGSLTHVPLVVDATTSDVLAACDAVGQLTVALDGRGDVDVADVVPGDGGVALVGGSESHGLPDDVIDDVDLVARLPMWGQAESLNLGTAMAIAAHGLARDVHAGG